MLARLRIARRLQACLMLLFLCSVGAATAAPWLGQGAALTVMCSGQGGLKLLDDPSSGSPARAAAHGHGLDCPLCLPLGMAPPCEFAVAATGCLTGALRTGGPETLRISVRVLRPPARAPPPDLAPYHHEASS